MRRVHEIAFYTPTKGLDGTNRSGERRIVETTLDLLRRAGFTPHIPTRLVTLDKQGDAEVQRTLFAEASAEAARIIDTLRRDPPALWWSYHSYYKCPDLIGPVVCAELGIPYVLQQPTLNPKHLDGPWSPFARASKVAHDRASQLLWSTERDLPALIAAGYADKLLGLRPVIEPGPVPALRPAHSPLRLLTVAMMPAGDKLESYRRLAAALAYVRQDWRLRIVGDGPARAEVEALFRPFGERVAFTGQLDPGGVAKAYEDADLMVWPGVGEGVGMVYLEAQAAGLPVIAEDHPAQRDLVEGPLAATQDPAAFARLLEDAAHDRVRRARAARARIEDRHTPDVVAPELRIALLSLLT